MSRQAQASQLSYPPATQETCARSAVRGRSHESRSKTQTTRTKTTTHQDQNHSFPKGSTLNGHQTFTRHWAHTPMTARRSRNLSPRKICFKIVHTTVVRCTLLYPHNLSEPLFHQTKPNNDSAAALPATRSAENFPTHQPLARDEARIRVTSRPRIGPSQQT